MAEERVDIGCVRQIFAPADPIPLPVLVVTGFLGSGKTTLVKQRLVEVVAGHVEHLRGVSAPKAQPKEGERERQTAANGRKLGHLSIVKQLSSSI